MALQWVEAAILGYHKWSDLEDPTAAVPLAYEATGRNYIPTWGQVQDFVTLGIEHGDSIKDRNLTAPPGGESTGDRYIPAATATGAWAGHENDIAQYNGSTWDFQTPTEGLTVWVDDEDITITWNGSAWVQTGGASYYSGTAPIDITGLVVSYDPTAATADTAVGATDILLIHDGANKKITFANFEGDISHANIADLTTGDPHTQYQLESEKGANNGYCGLDASGLVLFSDLPTGTGASQVAVGNHTHTGVYEPADATILKEADVDDTPVDAATTAPISSNWAYDHVAASDPHTGYQKESEKNAANGYCPLDASSDVPDANISSTSVTQHVGSIDHDSLLNFAANEHVKITSGTTAARPTAATYGVGYYWDTDNGTWHYSNGTTWQDISASPSTHASTHQHGGGDEVATATPGANVIPKAGADNKLAVGFIPDLSGTYEAVDATILREADVDDTPVDAATTAPISSNWAYDHVAASDPHTGYQKESEKNAANGYCGLDATGLVLFSDLPTGTGAAEVAVGNHAHAGVYEPVDATILREADVDDVPVDAATTAPISSNWAYDHENGSDPHTGYILESREGVASGVATLTAGTPKLVEQAVYLDGGTFAARPATPTAVMQVYVAHNLGRVFFGVDI